MQKRIGKQTVRLAHGAYLRSAASVAGKKEGEGPLGRCFDMVIRDAFFGEDSWEQAESRFLAEAMKLAVRKAGLSLRDMDYAFSGDLLNQSTASTFGMKAYGIPHFGIFSACAAIGEGLSLGAMLIDGGAAEHVLAGASSHFCAAEKQFRFPLPLGTQRPQTSTWTVTGAGAFVLSKEGRGPKITEVTTGKLVDFGIKDTANMGAAMAPAAASLLRAHFLDTGRIPQDYDVILTGDLGRVGQELLLKLLRKEGYEGRGVLRDCGMEIFDGKTQDTHAGGSGCACSALTFAGYYYKKLLSGELNRLLFVPTGALMSLTTSQQGLSIPAIAHGIVIESGREDAEWNISEHF